MAVPDDLVSIKIIWRGSKTESESSLSHPGNHQLVLISLGTDHAGDYAWKLGVTSESQNNPVSANGEYSAMTQSARILRKIKKAPKS